MTELPEPACEIDRLAAVLVAARQGGRRAVDELVVACRPFVEHYARRTAWRSDDVGEVVQEVWVRLLEHADAIREPRALLGWLAVVAGRTAVTVGRRRTRLVAAELDDRGPVSQATEELAMRSFERREVADGVRAALARLDAADRRILLLLEGAEPLPYREVSRETGRPIGSLGPTRQRVLRRLRHDPAVRRLRAPG